MCWVKTLLMSTPFLKAFGKIGFKYVLLHARMYWRDAISRREHAVSRIRGTSGLYNGTGVLLGTLICSLQVRVFSC